MAKLEITKDQNVARDKVLNSPLYKLVHGTWRYFDEEITSPVSLEEEDIIRYVLWCMENIKGSENDVTVSSQDLRRCVVNLFREVKYPSEVVGSLSNIICAYVLACLDCAFLYSYRNDIYRLCSIAENSIKKDYKQNVLECKEKIKSGILQSNLSAELGEWCTEHLLNDEFLTEDDAEWFKNDSSPRPLQAGESEDQKTTNGQNDETTPDITPMLKYCSDREKCKTIVQMLSGCNNVSDLKNAILSIDADGAMIDICAMDKIQFCRDIIPLIKYQTNDKALKQAIHRMKKT